MTPYPWLPHPSRYPPIHPSIHAETHLVTKASSIESSGCFRLQRKPRWFGETANQTDLPQIRKQRSQGQPSKKEPRIKAPLQTRFSPSSFEDDDMCPSPEPEWKDMALWQHRPPAQPTAGRGENPLQRQMQQTQKQRTMQPLQLLTATKGKVTSHLLAAPCLDTTTHIPHPPPPPPSNLARHAQCSCGSRTATHSAAEKESRHPTHLFSTHTRNRRNGRTPSWDEAQLQTKKRKGRNG